MENLLKKLFQKSIELGDVEYSEKEITHMIKKKGWKHSTVEKEVKKIYSKK